MSYIPLHPATPAAPHVEHTACTTNNGGRMNLTRRTTLGILGLLRAGRAFAHGRRMQGTMDDEHIERFVKHLAVDVNATPEQQKKLETIAKAAAHDLAPLRAQSQEMHKQGVALFTAPTVDKNA